MDEIYNPLPSRNSIRVFELWPGSDHHPLYLRLLDVELSAGVKYEAVSYTWGESKDTETVNINGNLVDIRQNLWNFLINLRRQDHFRREYDRAEEKRFGKHRCHRGQIRPRLLWADLICINQADLTEKAQQVQMMGRIFKTAQKVLVWLGPAADNSDEVFDEVEDYATCRDHGYAWPTSYIRPWWEGPPPEEQILSLLAIFQKPYWKRMWIIQEILVAKTVVVHCGQFALEWSDFKEILLAGYRHFRHLSNEVVKINTQADLLLQSLCGLLYSDGRGTEPTLDGLISRYGFGQCADKRDIVYSLLPLVTDHQGRKPPAVDYTIPLEELYRRCALYMSSQSNSACEGLRQLKDRFGIGPKEEPEEPKRKINLSWNLDVGSFDVQSDASDIKVVPQMTARGDDDEWLTFSIVQTCNSPSQDGQRVQEDETPF